MHEVLVNRLGGLSLPRKSVVRLTDHPDMTLDVYCGCLQNNNTTTKSLTFYNFPYLLTDQKISFLFFTLMVLTVSPFTVKILKIGTPEIITIIVLQFEQLDFTVQYCVQKMQTE